MASDALEETIRALRSTLGSEKVLTEDYMLQAYTKDLTLYGYDYQTPSLIVLPDSPAEVQEIVHVANRLKIPVLPLGGATSCWGANDSNRGIVIDTCHMNKIVEIDEKSMTFTVEAGANVHAVNNELKKLGYIYPTHPLCFGPISFGAEVSKNTGGEVGAMYGHVAKRIVALEVVLGNGDHLVTGSARVIKNAPLFQQSGLPDLTQLFVAAEGAYGVVTKVTMQMQMLPVAYKGVDIKFESTQEGFKAACEFVNDLRKRRGTIAGAHLIDWYNCWLSERARTVKGIDKSEEEVARKKHGHMLLVMIDSFVSEQDCEFKKEVVVDIAKQYGGVHTGSKMADAFHAGELGDTSFTKTVYSGGVKGVFWRADTPYDRVPLFYEKWLELLDQLGLPRSDSGTIVALGDEHCIPFSAPWQTRFNQSDPQVWAETYVKWQELAEKTYELFVEIGAIPYRVGRVWRPAVLGKLEPCYLKYIRTVKKVFDPNNIMNPGVSVFEDMSE